MNMDYNWEIDGNDGWMDTARYKSFALTVKAAIDRLHKRTGWATFAGIRRELGENCQDRWLTDAVNSLIVAGLIECVSEVVPTRYAPKHAVKTMQIKRRWNDGKAITVTDRTVPIYKK